MMTVTTPTFPFSLFIINNRYIGQPDSLLQESEKSNYNTTARTSKWLKGSYAIFHRDIVKNLIPLYILGE